MPRRKKELTDTATPVVKSLVDQARDAYQETVKKFAAYPSAMNYNMMVASARNLQTHYHNDFLGKNEQSTPDKQ